MIFLKIKAQFQLILHFVNKKKKIFSTMNKFIKKNDRLTLKLITWKLT